MKVTDKTIDKWLGILNANGSDWELIEMIRALKVERLVHLQQIQKFEAQVAYLTANQAKDTRSQME
jgi:hypothetical protein